jgi:hypothetical protein
MNVEVCYLRPDGTIERLETYANSKNALARWRRYFREDAAHWNIGPKRGRIFIWRPGTAFPVRRGGPRLHGARHG